MKTVYVVGEFAFNSKEEAGAMAMAMLGAKKVQAVYKSDSGFYVHKEYIDDIHTEVSVRTVNLCDGKDEAEEQAHIDMIKHKMGKFDKQDVKVEDIPF